VVAQLFLFREGRRDNPAMIAAAKGLTNDDLMAFAERVTKLPLPPPSEDPADPARFARGRTLTLRHPCGVCHNPDFSGREQMPRLANQREDYLLKAMREYKSGARLGYGGAMSQELAGLSDQDLIDLAHFLSHQGARP
jgi:cytochrome c553